MHPPGNEERGVEMNLSDRRFDLIDRYSRGVASKEEVENLESELEADREFREWYIDYLNIDLALNLAISQDLNDTGPFVTQSKRVGKVAMLAITSVIGCLVAALVFLAHFKEPFAVVVKSIGAGEFARGEEIYSEPFELEQGVLEIKTAFGANVVIEAPAVFQFVSPQLLRLTKGRVAARVPESAHGFTVETPTGKAIDLGTEFGVDVPEQGEAEIHVFEGEVIAESSGGKKQNLVGGEAFSLQTGAGLNRQLRSGAFILPREMPLFKSGDSNAQSMASQSILKRLESDPDLILLLDFESDDDLPQGKYSMVQGRWPGTRAPEFVREGDHMDLEISEETAWPEISLAAWVRLDRLGEPYQSLLHTDDWSNSKPGQVHWMITQANTMRLALFGNQTIPGAELGGYPNSRISVLPEQGRWVHLVTVYSSVDRLVRFYVNGQFDNEVQQVTAYPAVFGPSRIGNWNVRDRTLSGRVDEMLILGRKMDDNEISELFEIGNPYQTIR